MLKLVTPCIVLSISLLTGCGNSTTQPVQQLTEKPETAQATQSTPVAEPTSPVTTTPETTTAHKTKYAGTTLKGNDIRFTILDDESQTRLNVSNQSTGLVGAWGKLCSSAATVDQLKETAVTTTNSANETNVWRSLKYAAPENLRVDNVAATQLADAGVITDNEENCIPLLVDSKFVLDWNYESVTVGRYFGTTELGDPVTIQ